jgi:hypothetical protein
MKTTNNDRPVINLTAEDKAAWVERYNTKRTFPSTKVPCAKCNHAVVMFADNLHARVIKYGGPAALLENFECRDCASAAKNVVKDTLAKIKADRKAEREAKREAKILAMLEESLTKNLAKSEPEAPVEKTKVTETVTKVTEAVTKPVVKKTKSAKAKTKNDEGLTFTPEEVAALEGMTF